MGFKQRYPPPVNFRAQKNEFSENSSVRKFWTTKKQKSIFWRKKIEALLQQPDKKWDGWAINQLSINLFPPFSKDVTLFCRTREGTQQLYGRLPTDPDRSGAACSGVNPRLDWLKRRLRTLGRLLLLSFIAPDSRTQASITQADTN